MLRSCLLVSLLGLVSAQSSSVINNWYSASANSGPSVAASNASSAASSTASSTSLTRSTPSAASSSVVAPRTSSTLSSIASPSVMSSSIVRSSSTSSSPTSSSTAASSAGKALKAVATITPFNGSSVQGTVMFSQADANSPTIITWDFVGNMPNSQRGIHIHRDSSTDCNAAGPHYNPANISHGLLNEQVSHAGDLGNFMIDGSGRAKGSLSASFVKLFGADAATTVVGRTFVVHNDTDDGGKTGILMSTTTGNSGNRVGCGIITLSA